MAIGAPVCGLAEVRSGGGESVRRAERHGGCKIIDRLRHDPRPVDRVHPRQCETVAKGVMVEHAFHQGLAIVERAVDRDRVDIMRGSARDHAPLHIGNAPVWKQDDEIHPVAVAKGFDGGGPVPATAGRTRWQPRRPRPDRADARRYAGDD